MKTLLILSPHPEIAETIRANVNPGQYRVIHRVDAEAAEPLLAHGMAQVCIVDVELTGVPGIWLIEKLRRRDAQCPILIYTGAKQSEWEEEAYLRGVTHVLAKPVRPRVLNTLLDRLFAAPAAAAAPGPMARPVEVTAPYPSAAPLTGASQPLSILRNFSALLAHSFNAEAMLRQFLLQLREIVSLNRAAIFLRPPASTGAPLEGGRRLRLAGALGLAPGLLEHFELSFDTGLGGQLFRLGRILRRHSDEVRADGEAQKEFELLGGQVAVPIFDRDSLLGVAVFDGRITGKPFTNAELELIFHLLEQVGLALRNIWLHDQLAGNNDLLAGVLRELNSACVVVSRDLKILHANKLARKHFGQATRPTGEMEFTDLPAALGAKIYQVLRTGAGLAAFKYEPEAAPGSSFHVTVTPFQRQDAALPASVLLVMDDLTQSEQLRRLESEAANLRMEKKMGKRIAHEVGNAILPISINQELFAEKYRDPKFLASFGENIAKGVRRIKRSVKTMNYLAQDSFVAQETIPLSPLIEEAYQEACKHQLDQAEKTGPLKYDTSGQPVFITGDRTALKHALTEVMINALQANQADPQVGVSLATDPIGGSPGMLSIEVQDHGSGFTPEAMQKAVTPFYTTRAVGLGLGLTVTRKIIEMHRGKLEFVPPAAGRSNTVRISLPLDAAST